MPSAKYNPAEIEPKWQKYWEEHQTFRTPNPGEAGFDPTKPKYYVLDMFPYPSGSGLHVGHPEGYTATDILTRYKRMKGFNVLHPMGWDAYGLPAEQYAVQTGTHPAVTTQKNIASFRATLQRLGFSYDWSREVDTTDPDYYRWTQWIFLKLFNSVFDPSLNRARDVGDVIKDLKDGKIGLRSRGPADAADPAADLLFDMSSGEARAAGYGKQWSEIDAETQWRIIANHRLAYVSEAPVWWCEALGTVLANEEVIDGRSERGDHPCVKKPLRQWMLRITAYADRLLADLDSVDWPDAIKAMQRHWIGKSEGAEVDFEVEKGGKIRVFTTRPDTLYGATYMVLAPEHPLVKEITTDAQRAVVEKYVLDASRKSDLARTDLAKDKSGVFTGAYAWNPVYDDRTDPRAKIPIWIADYVLMGYGTGAIMAVPAHDERDGEFALKYNLPIVSVVMPPDAWLKDNFDPKKAKDLPGTESLGGGNTLKSSIAQFMRDQFRDHPATFKSFFTGDGTAMKSKAIDGLATPEAKKTIIGWLEFSKRGEQKITYRLRDWLFSRQRYWGEPFPIVWDAQGLAHPVSEIQLPVKLPEMKDFKPTGSTEPPLSKATNWVNVDCVIDPDGTANVLTPESTYTNRIVKCRRETNSMPQWAGSCWYYLRYTDAKNRKAPFSKEAEDYWMNVDLYVGGAEHAVLHLLYSRFWHKVLYDHGVVHTREPFQRLFNQGLIQAFVFQDESGRLIPNDEVEETPEGFRQKSTGAALKQNVGKMSKSLKNVIPADDVIQEHGADTLRLYEMFMGPLDSSKPWNPRDVPGMYRFLRDCWKVVVQDDEREAGAGNLRMNLLPSASENIGSDMKHTADLERELHKTIKGVTNDLERMAFNTAISKLMVFKNHVLQDVGRLNRDQARRFILLLAPFAPHLAEELWDKMRYGRSLAYEPWPGYDEALTVDATAELAIQINGKLRGKVVVATDAAKDAILAAAKDAVTAELAGKTIIKEVVVPGRLVNFVVK